MTEWSTKLYLVRHGETAWNSEHRLQGSVDTPLSDYGRRQADALAAALRTRAIAAIYSSGMRRADDTAARLAAQGPMHPRVDAALREVNLGAWEGRRPDDLSLEERDRYDAWRIDPVRVRPPDGETLDEARSRVEPALAGILSAHRGHAVVVVTHSISGRVALCHLLGADLDLVSHLKLKTASLSVVRVGPEGAVLEQLGDVSHLAGLVHPAVGHRADGAGKSGGGRAAAGRLS